MFFKINFIKEAAQVVNRYMTQSWPIDLNRSLLENFLESFCSSDKEMYMASTAFSHSFPWNTAVIPTGLATILQLRGNKPTHLVVERYNDYRILMILVSCNISSGLGREVIQYK